MVKLPKYFIQSKHIQKENVLIVVNTTKYFCTCIYNDFGDFNTNLFRLSNYLREVFKIDLKLIENWFDNCAE